MQNYAEEATFEKTSWAKYNIRISFILYLVDHYLQIVQITWI